MIGIYKIINPNSKVYVGQSVNINNRKRVYKFYSSYKNSIGPKLYNSLNKHGWSNHKHEILEECSIEQLNERETYWKKIIYLKHENSLRTHPKPNSSGNIIYTITRSNSMEIST